MLIAQSFKFLHYGTKSSKGFPAVHGIYTGQICLSCRFAVAKTKEKGAPFLFP